MRARALLALALALLLIPAAGLGEADTTPMPEAIYRGIAQSNITIRESMSRESAAIGAYRQGATVQIVGYEPGWLLVVKGTPEKWVSGYVLRHTVSGIAALRADSLPYGATPAAYTALLSQDTPLYAEPSTGADLLFTLAGGAKVAILSIEDGWARVVYWRQYGYFYLDGIQALTPVYDADAAQSGDTLSAFVSFFSLDTDGLNPNRVINISKACEYIDVTMEAGEAFSFNAVAGPFQYRRGYLDGMSFYEGEAVPSVGGGTCQVSSTLYNALLVLHGNVDILYRRAHGPSGATYLPHGVDAAVGNTNVDLVFRNAYDFAIQIEASASGGVLYIAIVKA